MANSSDRPDAVAPFPKEHEHFIEPFDAWVRGGKTPDDAAIAARMFQLTPQECEALKTEYLRRNRQFIDYTDPRVLRDNTRIESWYSGPDVQGAWCWPAYKRMIQDPVRGWDPADIAALDRASTKVLASVPHPGTPSFNSRGLVVGYVQSGKTANYSALISKAADVGYRLFIVMSGITSSLRRQTQERIESDIVEHAKGNWTLLTYPTADFGSLPAGPDALLDVQSHRKRVVAVIKKNVHILDRVIAWLGKASPDTLRQCPTIIIDDEADNASINTRDPAESPTSINERIRNLLQVLPKVAYIGYTATPFANIFINPTVTKDLFPRNFIFDLERPKAYFGAERIFGRNLLWFDASQEAPDGLDVVRRIIEADPAKPIDDDNPDEPSMLVPAKAKDRHDFQPVVPESLKNAINYFLLATAARYARGQDSEHSSMLVHTTMYVDLHDRTQAVLDDHLRDFRKNWPNEKTALAALWDEESSKVIVPGTPITTFAELTACMPKVLERAQVVVDNGRTESGLVYPKSQPCVVIAVGGNTFSRGLTLEGLVVSYFIRKAGAYDTLLQMGRWFGYRRGYEDLPRIWTTTELELNFFFLAGIEEEIRQDIRRLEKEGKTPEELAIRVRTHPKLKITARNKMGEARVASASYSNRRAQSFLFAHADAGWLDANLTAGSSLGRDLRKDCVEISVGRYLAKNVPVARILSFLEAYKFHKDHDDLEGRLLAGYIRAENSQGALKNWNVVFLGQRKPNAQLGTLDLGIGQELNCINRTRFKTTEPANIKALMSRADRVVDLPEADKKEEDADLVAYRNQVAPDTGLLVLYPISRHSLPEHRPQTKKHPAWQMRYCDSCRQDHEQPMEGSVVRHALKAARHVLGAGLVFPQSRQPEAEYMANNLDTLLQPWAPEEGEIVEDDPAELDK